MDEARLKQGLGSAEPIPAALTEYVIQTSIFESVNKLKSPEPKFMSKQPIFLRQDGMLKRIDPDEIILLQVDDNYVKFHKADSFLMVRTSLNAALTGLPANHFLKTHRTYAVSVHHIIEIARDHLILAGISDPIPISRQYYPEFMKRLTIIGSGFSDKKD